MAATDRLLKEVDDITECPICLQTMSNSKILPCIHSFCLKCLQQYGQRRKDGGEMNCPLCRISVPIENDDYTKLPNNFFVEKLITAKKSANEEFISDKGCYVCATLGNAKKAASMYCIECMEYMCDPCANIHRSMRISKTHKLRSTAERPSFIECMQSSVSYCDKHQSKEIEIFCTECKSAGCMMCYVQHHQSHKCSDVNTIADEFKIQLRNDIQEIEKLVLDNKNHIDEVRSISMNFAKNVDQKEMQIIQKSDEIKLVVDRHKETLVKQLHEVKLQQMKEYATFEEDLQLQLASFESFKRYSSEVLDKALPSDLAQTAHDLSRRSKELKDHVVGEVEELACVEIYPGVVDQIKGNGNWNLIGNISFAPSVLRPSSICYDKLPKFTEMMKFETMVSGVTVLKNELFVLLNDSSSDIRVYNSTTFNLVRIISVPRMSNLFDIVSCEDAIFVISCYDANKGVYSKVGSTNLTLDFENFKNECITIVKVQSPNMAALIWAVESNPTNALFGSTVVTIGQATMKGRSRQRQTNPGQQASISLTTHGNLLVGCSTVNMLTEYTRNGSLVRKISLNSFGFFSNQVLHAFNLPDDQFLVQNDNSLYVFDSLGQMLKNRQGNYHVYVDRDGTILVNDRQSNKLVSFDSSLNNRTEIIPQLTDFSNNLSKMYLDERAGKLYLNDDNSCGLLILQFLKI